MDAKFLKKVRAEARERRRRDKIKLDSNGAAYVGLYPFLKKAARANGYALCVHGSLVRDFDLVAVPWTSKARDPKRLFRALMRCVGATYGTEKFEQKPHGRVAGNVSFGGTMILDISIMPRI